MLDVKLELVYDTETLTLSLTNAQSAWHISGYQVYDHQLSMSEAEKFCISQSGHLPSVTSEAENDEIGKVAKRGFVWLGAKRSRESGKMLWVDKNAWDYED